MTALSQDVKRLAYGSQVWIYDGGLVVSRGVVSEIRPDGYRVQVDGWRDKDVFKTPRSLYAFPDDIDRLIADVEEAADDLANEAKRLRKEFDR